MLFCPLALSSPLPRTLVVRPLSQLTGDQRGLSSGGNQPGGMQHFSPPGELSSGSLYFICSSHGIWGVVGPSRGPLMGAASSMAASSMGMSVEAGWALPGTVVSAWSSRNPSSGATPSRTVSSKKDMYCFIISLNSRTLSTKRHGQPGIGSLDFSAQYWRACTYAMVFSNCSSLIFWQGNFESGGEGKSFQWRHLGASGVI